MRLIPLSAFSQQIGLRDLLLNAERGVFMKKRFFALIAFATMILAISAQALEPRLTEARPTLRFDETTAYCSVICYGESSNDTVDVTLTLYQGTSYVDSWSGSEKGRASLSESCGVSSGRSRVAGIAKY